ncbi:hypothetical protein ACHAXT_009392 [Thalassiosira profunda]
MGFVVFPLAEAIASLLLFDGSARSAHQLGLQMPIPVDRSSIVANPVGMAAPRLDRYQYVANGDSRLAASTAAVGSQYAWNLPNGSVEFARPLSFAGISMQDGKLASGPASSSISLWDPKLLGSNAKDQQSSNNVADEKIAVKVSWKRSRTSVENECSILQSLGDVPHVERCIGRPNLYPYEEGRVMIALMPVVTSDASEVTSSLKNVKAGRPQMTATKSVIGTMVGMLSAGVYTIDVQPLISVDSGETLFIDFTEASHFANPLTTADESALVGFCSEMLAVIPESLRDVAAELLSSELDAMNRNNMPLPEKVVDIVEGLWLD